MIPVAMSSSANRLLKKNGRLPSDSPGATCGRHFPRENLTRAFCPGGRRPPATPTQAVIQQPAQSGFTLVELLVAIGLSLAIIATATSAFTMVAKVIGRSEQLSRHNQTVRELYHACADDADFWWSIDDPFDATQQPYRATNGGTGHAANGHPFVPIELPPEYWNLRAHDPATWQRVGAFRRHGADGRNYALLGRIGDAEPWRATTHVVMDRTLNLLGAYGMADYLPQSWSWWYAVAPDGANSFGDILPFQYSIADGRAVPNKLVRVLSDMTSPGYNSGRLNATHATYVTPIARPSWALAHNPARTPLLANLAGQRSINSRSELVTQRVNWDTEAQAFYALPPHLRSRPPGWPIVRGGLLRTEDGAGRSAVIDATLVDPVTGERTTYHFMLIATSLRGARQQRDWPHWSPGPIRMDQ